MNSMTIPAEPTPLVSLVVPTFRRAPILAQSLRALLHLNHPQDRVEIIVVDDGSLDETQAVVAGLADPRIAFLQQPRNQGVAAARNRGAREARGDVLIFLDDDMLVQESMIERHLRWLRRFGACMVNGHWEFTPELQSELRTTAFGRFRLEVEAWVKTGIAFQPIEGSLLEPSGLTACNLGMWRRDFDRVGGFDEGFPFAGAEDQEFSVRAKAAGIRFLYDRDLLLWHNDQRLTLRAFCERQRRGAVTAALLARKYPERWATSRLLVENRPIQKGEPWRLVLKKLAKALFSTPPARLAAYGIARLVEPVSPNARALRRLYWAMCGAYIYLGFQEGLRRAPEAAAKEQDAAG